MNASDIMSKDVLTIKPDTTIEEIAHIMAEKNIGGLPVVDGDGMLVGIVTQKDMLYKDIEPRFPAVVEILGSMIFLAGIRQYREDFRKLVATKAEDIMTRDVLTVSEDTDIKRIAEIMVDKNINRVPVIRDGKLVGIIARGDIVRHIAGEM